MAMSSRERAAKSRSKTSSAAFSSMYLNKEKKATAEDFVKAKLTQAQSQIFGVVMEFDSTLLSQFYAGLAEIGKYDDRYAIQDMFFLWRDLLNKLKLEQTNNKLQPADLKEPE